MADSRLYHHGSRELQDRFDSRRVADRLEEVTLRDRFTEADRAFIESAPMFFLGTADAEGRPDVSYKGGMPGFVRVTGDSELAYPNYDGNGMYRSMGNVLLNPGVALLFIRFDERPGRLRVVGAASIRHDDPLLADFEGAQFVVRVQAERIFPNCPRYIHRMQLVEYSAYAPRPDHVPPVPGWKKRPEFRGVLPRRSG